MATLLGYTIQVMVSILKLHNLLHNNNNNIP